VNERNILTKNKLHDTHEVILFHDFDVFACTETWLKPPIHDDELNLQNYNIFRQDRPGAKTGGGIMIYVKDCYEVTVIPTKYSAPLESLEIKIRKENMKPTHLIVIYRPKETPITLLQQMEADLISHSDKHTFLIGDFNIDNAKSTSLSCSLKSLVERNGFHQLINQPTRITEHSETIIDLIITNIAHLCSSFGVQSCTIADHELIYVVKKKPKDYRQPPKMINARDFKNADPNKITSMLETAPWWILDMIPDPTQMYNVYCGIINHILDVNAPFKKFRARTKNPIG
jgi:hypothetical protein